MTTHEQIGVVQHLVVETAKLKPNQSLWAENAIEEGERLLKHLKSQLTPTP